jgi:hypothetical protein
MKLRIVRQTLSVIPIAALYMTLTQAAQADNSCSVANAAGNWGVTLTGVLLLPTGPVPAAATIRANFDARGNITSSTEARNVGGGFANETLTGSWTVNSDCTGTLTVQAYASGVLVRTSVASILFVDNMKEVRMVQQSLTLPGGSALPVVITIDGKRLLPDSAQ